MNLTATKSFERIKAEADDSDLADSHQAILRPTAGAMMRN